MDKFKYPNYRFITFPGSVGQREAFGTRAYSPSPLPQDNMERYMKDILPTPQPT